MIDCHFSYCLFGAPPYLEAPYLYVFRYDERNWHSHPLFSKSGHGLRQAPLCISSLQGNLRYTLFYKNIESKELTRKLPGGYLIFDIYLPAL